jgi:hypothetical protein
MSDGANDPDKLVDAYDTPTQRASINRLSVDDLDAWLIAIRERRLATVQKLEAAAKVRADEVRLVAFLKYEKQYQRAKNALAKLDEQIDKVEATVHKCRMLALAAELEVSAEGEEDGEC